MRPILQTQPSWELDTCTQFITTLSSIYIRATVGIENSTQWVGPLASREHNLYSLPQKLFSSTPPSHRLCSSGIRWFDKAFCLTAICHTLTSSLISLQLTSWASPDNILVVTWKWLTSTFVHFNYQHNPPNFLFANSDVPPTSSPFLCMYWDATICFFFFFQLMTGLISFVFVSRYLCSVS